MPIAPAAAALLDLFLNCDLGTRKHVRDGIFCFVSDHAVQSYEVVVV